MIEAQHFELEKINRRVLMQQKQQTPKVSPELVNSWHSRHEYQ